MKQERGFVMGVVLIGLLALSLAGATAVLLASSEVDMAGALRSRRQLEACATSGVEVTASNLPTPANAPTVWSIDPYSTGPTHLFQTKPEHIDTTQLGPSGLTSGYQTLGSDAASAILAAAGVGGSVVNTNVSLGGVPGSTHIPSAGQSQQLQVFRLLSTCEQKTTAARLEAEGVYVYNPN